MRKKDENKALMIREKAIEMIVNKGFDGLSMGKLAKAANISASTIYIYFENREDLLNTIFNEVVEEYEKDALQDFDWMLNFEAALWLQWKNRYRNVIKNPMRFSFFFQFLHSHLIKNHDNVLKDFRQTSLSFAKKAMEQKELIEVPADILWVLCFGPFYELVRFHLNKENMLGEPFELNEKKLKQTFDIVMKSLRP